jgi:hypothetical protein
LTIGRCLAAQLAAPMGSGMAGFHASAGTDFLPSSLMTVAEARRSAAFLFCAEACPGTERRRCLNVTIDG